MLVLILSLPRSGSTLLQRMISDSSSQARSGSESWLYCALSSLVKSECPSVYDSRLVDLARADNKSLYSDIIVSIRERMDSEGVYIEKTPRNLLVWESVEAIGYDELILLTRNPFAILSSMSTTWLKGSLSGMHIFYNDLIFGLARLDALVSEKSGYICQYEDLVRRPDYHRHAISKILNLDASTEVNNLYTASNNKLGDPLFGIKYNAISDSSIDTWKHWVVANPIRYMLVNIWRLHLRRTMKSEELKAYLEDFPKFSLKCKYLITDTIGILKLSILFFFDKIVKKRYRYSHEKKIWL